MTDNYFYGHGKLLLTSEYFVLEGAKALAMPTNLGQQMHVSYRPSGNPKLYWKSFDEKNNLWFEATFELWHFDVLEFNSELDIQEEVEILQKILRQARKQNIHFLREEVDFHASTTLEFPREWGFGTSSTLVYNIAQWAYISPFELLEKTFGGSGYDIACAQSMGPVLYQNQKRGPSWETATFNPPFKDNLYFLYLNEKQSSREAIERYNNLEIENKAQIIDRLNDLTYKFLNAVDLKEFEEYMIEHERIISGAIDMPRIKEVRFNDYWGEVKSLGAWGGDFALVTSDRPLSEVQAYFEKRGYNTILEFNDIILQNFSMFKDTIEKLEDEISSYAR